MNRFLSLILNFKRELNKYVYILNLSLGKFLKICLKNLKLSTIVLIEKDIHPWKSKIGIIRDVVFLQTLQQKEACKKVKKAR